MARTAASGKMNLIYTDVSMKYGNNYFPYFSPYSLITLLHPEDTRQTYKTLGPLARVGPNDLVTCDPEIIRLMGSARSQYKRSEWYEAMRLDPYVDSIFSEMSVPIHDARRAKMSAAYSGKENPFLEADIDSCISSFINLIKSKYVTTGDEMRAMDFGRKAQFFTLDVITKVSYGEAFGYLDRDEDVHEYIKTTEDLVPWLTFFAVVPLANNILNRSWIKEKIGPSPKDDFGMGKLMG